MKSAIHRYHHLSNHKAFYQSVADETDARVPLKMTISGYSIKHLSRYCSKGILQILIKINRFKNR